MREIVWTGFTSLDGVVDSPGGTEEGHRNGGWVLSTEFVPEAHSLKAEELEETSALMFGRRSYEAFAPAWRDSEDHAAYRDLPKLVVSSTLTEARSSTAGARPRSCGPPTTSPPSRRVTAGRSSSTGAPSWRVAWPRPTWSTGTTC